MFSFIKPIKEEIVVIFTPKDDTVIYNNTIPSKYSRNEFLKKLNKDQYSSFQRLDEELSIDKIMDNIEKIIRDNPYKVRWHIRERKNEKLLWKIDSLFCKIGERLILNY